VRDVFLVIREHLGVYFFQNTNQSLGAVGADDVTVGLYFRPFAVNMHDVDDAGIGMVLAKQPGSLPGYGRREPVAKQDDIELVRRLSSGERIFLRMEADDFVSGGCENKLA
jgi:hypothetical protein